MTSSITKRFRDPQTGLPFPWEFRRGGEVKEVKVSSRLVMVSLDLATCTTDHFRSRSSTASTLVTLPSNYCGERDRQWAGPRRIFVRAGPAAGMTKTVQRWRYRVAAKADNAPVALTANQLRTLGHIISACTLGLLSFAAGLLIGAARIMFTASSFPSAWPYRLAGGNGIFATKDRRAESAPETLSARRDRKAVRENHEKWPQKRASRLLALRFWFRKTGWWANRGSNLGPTD
jgi:hypothetical protein